MGNRYEIGVRTPAAAAGAAYMTIHTGASYRARIVEIGVDASAGTLSSVGWGKPANTPVATTSVLGQQFDGIDAVSTVNVDTAWSTAPTVPANFFRRFAIPATAGAGFIWTYPDNAPRILAVSSWLCLWNFGASAGAALDVYVVWEE